MTRVHIAWQKKPAQPTAEVIRRVICKALEKLGEGRNEVHVLMTDDRSIRELNRRYRNADRATDVLSFPNHDLLPTGEVLLGEIVISVEAARRQAAAAGHSERREIEELALHGTLHLLGYDHDKDAGEMDAQELELREELVG